MIPPFDQSLPSLASRAAVIQDAERRRGPKSEQPARKQKQCRELLVVVGRGQDRRKNEKPRHSVAASCPMSYGWPEQPSVAKATRRTWLSRAGRVGLGERAAQVAHGDRRAGGDRHHASGECDLVHLIGVGRVLERASAAAVGGDLADDGAIDGDVVGGARRQAGDGNLELDFGRTVGRVKGERGAAASRGQWVRTGQGGGQTGLDIKLAVAEQLVLAVAAVEEVVPFAAAEMIVP